MLHLISNAMRGHCIHLVVGGRINPRQWPTKQIRVAAIALLLFLWNRSTR